MTKNEETGRTVEMIELSGAALDAVAGGQHGADDAAAAVQAPQAPEVVVAGDAQRGK